MKTPFKKSHRFCFIPTRRYDLLPSRIFTSRGLQLRLWNCCPNAKTTFYPRSEEQWREAAINFVNAVRRDFFALLAGFRQSVACRYQEGIDQYLGPVIHPAFQTLVDLRPPLWSPNEQLDEISKWITDAAVLPPLPLRGLAVLFHCLWTRSKSRSRSKSRPWGQHTDETDSSRSIDI